MKKTIKAALCAALAAAIALTVCACTAQVRSSKSAVPPLDASQNGGESSTIIMQSADKPEEITVSASSTVRLAPDKATVTFGVTTQESTAEKAQTKNSEAVQKVIVTLTESGVEEKSIRTVNYSRYPQYDYSVRGDARMIGYTVYTMMSVQDQDIDGLGKLLAACVNAGINQVDSVQFFCSGYDEAYADALAQAVAVAREKAEALAQAAGKTLGEAVTMTEGWQNTYARYGVPTNGAYFEAEMADSAMPAFQPGETEIEANVTVTFSMS